MRREARVTVRLTRDEDEWVRRHAYWSGVSRSDAIRSMVHAAMREAGYLRPPDDEPQDFGYEKELMQSVLRIGDADRDD